MSESRDPENTTRLDLARTLALEAGALTLRHFQLDDLRVEMKQDGTPVTIADREAEQVLRQGVMAEFPDDGLIGEEFGVAEGRSDFRWVFDPIDGTKSFACGVPLYGTLVAVERRVGGVWRSVVGVVNMPALGEMVYAADGCGAWQEVGGAKRAARVSGVTTLRESVMVLTGGEYTTQAGAEGVQRRLASACRLVRGWSDCYGLVLVATGRAEVWFEPVVREWDVAPAPVILREAGGTFTDWRGVEDIRSGTGLGTNGRIHAEALAIIQA